MIMRTVAAAVALGLTLSNAAQALPVLTAPVLAARPATATETAWVDPPRTATAPAAPSVAKPGATASAEPTQNAVMPKPVEAAPVAPEPAPVMAARRPAASIAPAPAPKKPVVRNARYAGGEGASWKTGRNAYAFSGSYGGCRITGHAGPRGFTIDRVC